MSKYSNGVKTFRLYLMTLNISICRSHWIFVYKRCQPYGDGWLLWPYLSMTQWPMTQWILLLARKYVSEIFYKFWSDRLRISLFPSYTCNNSKSSTIQLLLVLRNAHLNTDTKHSYASLMTLETFIKHSYCSHDF